MADSKQEETFKVVDRRLFTEDGQLRRDVVEQQRRDEEAAQKPATKASSISSSASSAQGKSGAASANATAPAPLAEAAQPSRGFQLLVDFLTRNAAAMLGGVADPRTGQAYLDLDGAREMIDMLDALRETTQGNLAQVDEDLLIEVIGSLKLTYMEVSKAAADAMTKKAKSKG